MNESIKKLTIIIPSLNPDEKLIKVVSGVFSAHFKHVIIVNDGSDKAHLAPFKEAEKLGATILTHEVNRGKGRGLKTAFSYVLENLPECEGVITIDGDNQHTLPDIIACGERMLECGNKVILGCRDFSGKDVPFRSRFGNNTTAKVFKYLCGINISDTQTGLRAIPRQYLEAFLDIKGERFEYETNMLLDFKEFDIPYDEVKISTVYINENETSHFNPLVDSIKIYSTILKFTFGSLSSSLLDFAIFYVFLRLCRHFFASEAILTMVATVVARVLSSIYNFLFNQKAVFKSKTSLAITGVRYCILCVSQMLLSGVLLIAAKTALGITSDELSLICKIIIDTLLFFVSFPIQRKWVFK